MVLSISFIYSIAIIYLTFISNRAAKTLVNKETEKNKTDNIYNPHFP